MCEKIDTVHLMVEKLSLALVDTLDACHVPNLTLDELHRLESATAINSQALSSDSQAIGQPFRQLSLYFAKEFITTFLSDNEVGVLIWFEVSRICDEDMHWLVANVAVWKEKKHAVLEVLARAAAAIHLAICLQTSKYKSALVFDELADFASAHSHSLGGDDVDVSTIKSQHRRILTTLSIAPSVHRWLSIFMARLNCCFSGKFHGDTIAKARVVALGLAVQSVIVLPASVERSNHSIAVFCAFMALVSAGLVPEDVFDLHSVEDDSSRNLAVDAKHAAICVAFHMNTKEISACIAAVRTSPKPVD